MIGYITLGTNDLDGAKRFYDQVLKPLRGQQLMPLADGVLYGADRRPNFGLVRPENGEAATGGNGTMISLYAPSRAVVDQVHALALQLGGADEGAPGVRNPANAFYAAYFRDLDGNKICVFRMGPS